MKCTNFSPGDTNDPQIQTNHPTPLFAPKDITLIRHSLALYDNEDNDKKMTTKKKQCKRPCINEDKDNADNNAWQR